MAKDVPLHPPANITWIAEDSVFEGTVHAVGDVRIDGRVVGLVHAEERVVVAPRGRVDGDIDASTADVSGQVEGEVRATKRLVLRREAAVLGTIQAEQLAVEDGATFTGTCHMRHGVAAVGPQTPSEQVDEEPPFADATQEMSSKPELPETPVFPHPDPTTAAGASRLPEEEAGLASLTLLPTGTQEGSEPLDAEAEQETSPEDTVSEESAPVPPIGGEEDESGVEHKGTGAREDTPVTHSSPEERDRAVMKPVGLPPTEAFSTPRATKKTLSEVISSEPPTKEEAFSAPASSTVEEKAAWVPIEQRTGEPAAPSPERSVPPSPQAVTVPAAPAAGAGETHQDSRFRQVGLSAVAMVVLVACVYFGVQWVRGNQGAEQEPALRPAAEAVVPEEARVSPNEDGPSMPPAEAPGEDLGEEAAAEPEPVEDEASRRRAEQRRAAMVQARQQVVERGAEPEVASLFREAEAAQQTATEQFDAGAFGPAAASFRAARDRYDRVRERLDEKDRSAEQRGETAAADTSATAEEVAVGERAAGEEQDAEEDAEVQAAVAEVETVARRLSGYLRNAIEGEDLGGMQALFYRGWESFFEEAEGITATVQTSDVQVEGTQARIDVQVGLAYRDQDGQPQQQARRHVWELTQMNGDWVLTRVITQ